MARLRIKRFFGWLIGLMVIGIGVVLCFPVGQSATGLPWRAVGAYWNSHDVAIGWINIGEAVMKQEDCRWLSCQMPAVTRLLVAPKECANRKLEKASDLRTSLFSDRAIDNQDHKQDIIQSTCHHHDSLMELGIC